MGFPHSPALVPGVRVPHKCRPSLDLRTRPPDCLFRLHEAGRTASQDEDSDQSHGWSLPPSQALCLLHTKPPLPSSRQPFQEKSEGREVKKLARRHPASSFGPGFWFSRLITEVRDSHNLFWWSLWYNEGSMAQTSSKDLQFQYAVIHVCWAQSQLILCIRSPQDSGESSPWVSTALSYRPGREIYCAPEEKFSVEHFSTTMTSRTD